MPAVAKIDQQCAELLLELVKLWESPIEKKSNFNIALFKEYLASHENGEVEIHYLADGYPLWLQDRSTKNLSRSVHNIVKSKDELYAVLLRMVKEARKGYITGTTKKGHYQLNLLCVPKKNNITGEMTEIRVVRHGSYATRRKTSINSKIDKEKCKPEELPNIRKYFEKLIQFDYVTLRDLKDAFR